MNSKKKWAVLGILVIVLLNCKAQLSLNYNNNNKTFNTTIPAIDYPQKKGALPYTKAFLETGNGFFFILTTADYQQRTIPSTWNFNPQITIHPPLAQLNTFYDTTGRPPHATSIASFNPQTTIRTNPPQNLLASGKFISIFTSVTSTNATTIIPGDTMTVALTYKNTVYSGDDINSYNKSIIAFYYNGSENPNIFSLIPSGSNATPYYFNGVAIPALRTHNQEEVKARLNIAPAILTQLDTANSGYSKVLYISVPYDPTGKERNIFISMVPSSLKSDFTLANTSFKAVLIDYKDLNPGNVSEFIQPLGVDFASRDPNEIFTTPHCLSNHSGTGNEPIDYKIHFENIGAGAAKTIYVTVFIPDGINMPDDGTSLFTCTVGDIIVPVFKEGGNVILTKLRQCFYRLDREARTITFTIRNAAVAGTLLLPGQRNYNYGDIHFKLTKGTSNNQVCMQSKVSIVFDSNKAEIDTDIIFPGCKPLVKCPDVLADPHIGQ